MSSSGYSPKSNSALKQLLGFHLQTHVMQTPSSFSKHVKDVSSRVKTYRLIPLPLIKDSGSPEAAAVLKDSGGESPPEPSEGRQAPAGP